MCDRHFDQLRVKGGVGRFQRESLALIMYVLVSGKEQKHRNML